MSTKPAEKRLQRKIKKAGNKLGYANRKIVMLKAYIAKLEEMIYMHVDPTGFEGLDEKICSDISARVNQEDAA